MLHQKKWLLQQKQLVCIGGNPDDRKNAAAPIVPAAAPAPTLGTTHFLTVLVAPPKISIALSNNFYIFIYFILFIFWPSLLLLILNISFLLLVKLSLFTSVVFTYKIEGLISN